MPKFPNLSLYDLFGYLVPGFVALVALSLPFRTYEIIDYGQVLEYGITEWLLILTASYILGHVVEQAGRYLFSLKKIKIDEKEIDDITNDVMVVIAGKISTGLGLGSDMPEMLSRTCRECPVEPNRRLLLKLCNRVLTQKGNTAAREIYMRGEGFCRGMCISSFLLLLMLFISLIAHSPLHLLLLISFLFFRINIFLTQILIIWPSLFAVLIIIISGTAFYYRYKAFAKRRIHDELFGFLALSYSTSQSGDILNS